MFLKCPGSSNFGWNWDSIHQCHHSDGTRKVLSGPRSLHADPSQAWWCPVPTFPRLPHVSGGSQEVHAGIGKHQRGSNQEIMDHHPSQGAHTLCKTLTCPGHSKTTMSIQKHNQAGSWQEWLSYQIINTFWNVVHCKLNFPRENFDWQNLTAVTNTFNEKWTKQYSNKKF